MSRTQAPVYDSELGFYRALGIRWETGRHFRKLGVLKPDAKTVSGRPLYLADLATLEKAKARIADYRARQNRARANLQELSHV
jgi:hypothetical protein